MMTCRVTAQLKMTVIFSVNKVICMRHSGCLCVYLMLITGPDIVPEARRSPGRMLHPVTVWCTSCCFIVQYM